MRVRSLLSALVAATLLAACGGGGGSTGGSVPPPTGGGLSSASVQRSDSQSALVGVEGYQSFATGGSSALAVGPTIRRLVAKINPRTLIEHRDTTTTTGCEPGTGGGATDTTVTTDSATEENLTLQTYYDTACADLESTLTWTATLSSTASGYTITGPATFSEYADGSTTADESATAVITIYENGSGYATGVSILLTSVTEDGAAVGSLGVACSVSTSTGASTACGIAIVTIGGSSQLGAVANVTVSGTSVDMKISQYAGSSLTIATATFPDWTITPSSSLTQSVSISGSAAASGYTLALTDSANDGTYTIDGNTSTGNVTGTLVQTGSSTTYASFAVDSAGNGTVTYANGSTENIVDYIIQS